MKKFFELLFIVFFTTLIFSACEEEDTPAVKITMQSDKESIIADGEEIISFTVLTEDGVDVTYDAVLKIGNDIIESNTYSSTVAGSFNCTAEYKSSASYSLSFEVKEVPVFKKNILIENYTAIWCGWCPRIHDAITKSVNGDVDERIIPIAIHGSDDPYLFTSIGTLANKFGVTGYPTAIIDRDYSWPYPEDYRGLNTGLNRNSALGIAISSEISGDFIMVDAKVKFGKTYSNNLKIVVCLVESNLIYNQENFYDDGRGPILYDYEHNNVLRKYGTDLFGDDIPKGTTIKDSEYSLSITFGTSNYVKENCYIIVFVVDSNDILQNIQRVAANGTKDYELLDK